MLALFSLSLLFALIGMASKTILIYTGDDDHSYNIGIFTTTVELEMGDVKVTYIDNEDTCGDRIIADGNGR